MPVSLSERMRLTSDSHFGNAMSLVDFISNTAVSSWTKKSCVHLLDEAKRRVTSIDVDIYDTARN